MKQRDELEIWAQLKAGDVKALDYFYDTYVQSLYNYGRKITDRQEIITSSIQDVFVDIWKNRSSLSLPDYPKFYLFKALRYRVNRELKYARKQGEEEPLVDDFILPYEPAVPSVEHSLIASQRDEETHVFFQRALKKLPKRQREAIVLRFYEEMSYDEIAMIMTINTQSVYNLIHQGIHLLKKDLTDKSAVLTQVLLLLCLILVR